MPLPEVPILFLKPTSAILDPDGHIFYPASSSQVDYEGELAVVIGKCCKNIQEEEAEKYILGYTRLQRRDSPRSAAQRWPVDARQELRHLCPLRPWIAKINPSDADIQTRVNGKVVQKSNTSDLIFDVPKLVQFISGVMTLEPGDLIATGTPP